MPTLKQIEEQIGRLPHRYIFWTQKEIRALPEILDADERVVAITSGIMDGSTWLATCTNRRVIFLNKNMFFGAQQQQIALDRLQSIDHQYTIFFGEIRVWDGASYFTLRMVAKSSIEAFVSATQRAAAEYKQHLQSGHPAKSGANAGASVAAELEKLADLKARGVLTEEEFAAQKRKLLS